MKKYRLLKDLPLFPAGTICEIREPDNYSKSVFEVNADGSLVEIMDRGELRVIRDEGKFDEWFEEVDESKAWKPEEGGKYYCISYGGSVYLTRYFSDKIDRHLFEIGNCFKTAEEAEKAVEKLKALRRLREKGLKFKSWEASGIHITIHASIPDISCSSRDVTDLDLLFKEKD